MTSREFSPARRCCLGCLPPIGGVNPKQLAAVCVFSEFRALDRLGQKKWQRRRTKTQEAVRKLAGELLALYARREKAERPAYGPDTVWQQEFEASFIYQETSDQIKAIADGPGFPDC